MTQEESRKIIKNMTESVRLSQGDEAANCVGRGTWEGKSEHGIEHGFAPLLQLGCPKAFLLLASSPINQHKLFVENQRAMAIKT